MMDLKDQFLDHQLLKVHLENLENLKLHKFYNNIDRTNSITKIFSNNST